MYELRGPYENELYHHGIKGQKWGVRRFQNMDGSLTYAGHKRYGVGYGNEGAPKSTITRKRKMSSEAKKRAALRSKAKTLEVKAEYERAKAEAKKAEAPNKKFQKKLMKAVNSGDPKKIAKVAEHLNPEQYDEAMRRIDMKKQLTQAKADLKRTQVQAKLDKKRAKMDKKRLPDEYAAQDLERAKKIVGYMLGIGKDVTNMYNLGASIHNSRIANDPNKRNDPNVKTLPIIDTDPKTFDPIEHQKKIAQYNQAHYLAETNRANAEKAQSSATEQLFKTKQARLEADKKEMEAREYLRNKFPKPDSGQTASPTTPTNPPSGGTPNTGANTDKVSKDARSALSEAFAERRARDAEVKAAKAKKETYSIVKEKQLADTYRMAQDAGEELRILRNRASKDPKTAAIYNDAYKAVMRAEAGYSKMYQDYKNLDPTSPQNLKKYSLSGRTKTVLQSMQNTAMPHNVSSDIRNVEVQRGQMLAKQILDDVGVGNKIINNMQGNDTWGIADLQDWLK